MSGISAEEYARLKAAGAEATGTPPLVLPEGVIDRLYADLECRRCGRFVCYRHTAGVKPGRNKPGFSIPSPDGRSWSRPIAESFLEKYQDELAVYPDAPDRAEEGSHGNQ